MIIIKWHLHQLYRVNKKLSDCQSDCWHIWFLFTQYLYQLCKQRADVIERNKCCHTDHCITDLMMGLSSFAFNRDAAIRPPRIYSFTLSRAAAMNKSKWGGGASASARRGKGQERPRELTQIVNCCDKRGRWPSLYLNPHIVYPK